MTHGERVANRICRLALMTLPADFRQRYGADITDVLTQRIHEATLLHGWPGVIGAGIREAFDLVATGIQARWERRGNQAETFGAPPVPRGSPADRWRRDIRHSVRALFKRPAYFGAAVLTLALGIGANTAIFSIVRGVVLRPLPYERPDRLVLAWEDLVREGNHRFSASRPNFEDWQRQNTVFSAMAAQFGSGMRLALNGAPELARGAKVTGNFFQVLGVTAALGRTLAPADTLPGNGNVAVLSHAIWRQRFGGSADVIGRSVMIDGAPVTIIGVMPPEFSAPTFFKAPHLTADLWVPLTLPPAWSEGRDAAVLQVIARLKDDMTLPAAQAQLSIIGRRLADAYPATNEDIGVNLVTMNEQIIGNLRPSLFLLLGAVGFLLLIACANVANLALARSLDRRREVGVRLALGASRADVIRQFFAEGMLVAIVGGMAAIAVGWGGMRLLLAFAPPDTVRLDQVRLDPVVLGFGLGITALVGITIGLVPAFHGSRVDLKSALSASGERGSARAARFRWALVMGQVALAVVLLAGAGLMVRTMAQLARVDLGFAPDHLLTMRFGIPEEKYSTPASQVAYLRALRGSLEQVPGVESASFSSRLPLDPAYGVAPISVAGRETPDGERPVVGARLVSSQYFQTMAIPLVEGRPFGPGDSLESPPVALVNRSFARRIWPGESPIGKRIGIGASGPPWTEVIGVVGDVTHDGVGSDPIAEVYMPFDQQGETGGTLVLRTRTDPASLESAIRQAALKADPDQALIDIRPMTDLVAGSVAPRRFTLLLLGSFALLALVLSAVGVYGVLAYMVGQRRRELGIRIALGAQRRQVLFMIARQGAAMALIGTAIGLAGAMVLTRFLASQLYHVSRTDPATLLGVCGVLLMVALIASYLPARRAASADPARALRDE